MSGPRQQPPGGQTLFEFQIRVAVEHHFVEHAEAHSEEGRHDEAEEDREQDAPDLLHSAAHSARHTNTFPGLRIPFGSSARLMRRMASMVSRPSAMSR